MKWDDAQTSDSNLVQHALTELRAIGYGPDKEGFDKTMQEQILGIVAAFSEGGHSGSSAAYTVQILTRLLSFQHLGSLTSDAAEWQLHEGCGSDGADMWQNRRNSAVFSNDGGKTAYHLNDRDRVVEPGEIR